MLVLYAFGDYVLDLSLYQLRHGSEVVPLEPKVFDVLRYLVEHHERVATKRELLDNLWPNEAVTEAVLPTNINSLRRALGQKRGERVPIETVHGRGYRLAMPVTCLGATRVDSLPAGARLSLIEDIALEPEEDLLVGHEQLLRKLRRCLLKSLHGQGQVCILRGEAGIGKSRIARHICDLSRARGADVWISACPDGVGTPPLWLWQGVFRSAKASEDSSTLRRYLGKGTDNPPWLSELLDEGATAATELHERERFRLYDAVVRLLSGAARTRPRIVWLEDMHHADEASWQLLRLLAPHLETVSVLVLCTVRSQDDLTTALPVQRNVDSLARLAFCHRFHVGPLEEQETRQLAERLSGGKLKPELARTIHAKTGGNPLFISEVVDWLGAHGRSGDAEFPETPSLAPPDLVQHVLARRVERLGQRAALVLQTGAVLGMQFESSVIAAVGKLAPDAVSEATDQAVEKGILVPVPERVQTYRFAHALLRDTLYANLGARERRQLHAAAARHMEGRAESLGTEAICSAALHHYHALPDGDALAAIDWLRRAAAVCTETEASADAARFYRLALNAARLLPEIDANLRDELSQAADRARAKAARQVAIDDASQTSN